jgi:MFS family permease
LSEEREKATPRAVILGTMDRIATSRTNLFLNLGHAVDHLMMLIFPTAVLAMGVEFGRSYADLLPLSIGGFIAFGAGSLPAGWLGDRWSRRGMMIVFFVGIGMAGIITGFAQNEVQIFLGLTLIGLFGAIYHPVGIAMLVSNPERIGRDLGLNGLWGNLGVAFAALLTGALADLAGWRAGFIVPGVLVIAIGIAFAAVVPRDVKGAARPRASVRLPRATMARLFAVLLAATVCGGIIFNATTIAMPKIFDERLTALVQTNLGIGTLVCAVYVLAALAQLMVGRLIDRRPLRQVFLPVAALQVPLLLLAGSLENWAMLAVAIGMMFFVFGQIPINDAMVARHTDEAWRSRVYAVRYVVSFGASSLSVPLVALMLGTGWGFGGLFVVLAGLAVITTAAAFLFPDVTKAAAQTSAAPAAARA